MSNSSCHEELILKAVQGDQDAMGELLTHFRPYLRILARRQMDRFVNARVDPSDIVQLTCLEACRGVEGFRGRTDAELVAWLQRILSNNVLQTIQAHYVTQKRSVAREQSLPDDGSNHQNLPQLLAAQTSSPSQRVMRGEMAVRVAREVERLPEDQREAVRLRHFEGWSLAELAEHFGRSEAATAGLIKRGLRALRSQLSDVAKDSRR